MIRYGYAANGAARIACRPCGVSLNAEQTYSRLSVRKPTKYRLAAYLLGAGKSTREVESMIGISKKVVNDIRRSIFQNTDVLCGCGQEAGHRGWCSFRYDQSPARQATMARMGRPPKTINVELVKLLRAQGQPFREIAALLGVNRATIYRKLEEDHERGRMPPWFCVGILNKRAALAIKRLELMEQPIESGEAFSNAMSEVWKAARDSGCPKCGAVRKLSNGECRRCITIRIIIHQAESEIAGTVRAFIFEAQRPFREFANSLAKRRGLQPAQRLQMLLEKVHGTETGIATQN